jgi:LysM repeat protein
MANNAKDVLAVARQFARDGYKEGKNNKSVFGEWYGLQNNPWCAMFVSYAFNKAGAGSLIAGAQSKKGFASCTYGYNFFKKKGRIVKTSEAQAGDIVFFDWEGNGSPDHVGIVISNNPARKTLKTIEGNTSSGNTGSQSNGEGAYERTRGYATVYAVARPGFPVEKPSPSEGITLSIKPVVPVVVLPEVKVAPKAEPKKYATVAAGDSYWKIAARVLGVKNTPVNALKITRESKRLQALNAGKPLVAGKKIRTK